MNRKTTMHPGKILSEKFLKPGKISGRKLAEDIHCPVSLIQAVIKGRGSVTADLALRLGRYFGNEPGYWMKLQNDHDLCVTAETICGELERILPPSDVGKVSRKPERKTEQRTPEQKKRLAEWLKKCKNSDEIEIKFSILGALSTLKKADFTHPTDVLAQAAVTVGDIDAIHKLAAAGYKRWCIKDIVWHAFRTPCADVVKFIVEQGFDVNDTDSDTHKGPYTPLCVAAEYGQADVVQYLLSHGAEATYRNSRGFTPLHFAASSGSLETVKLLVDAGADINAMTKPRRNWWSAMSVLHIMAQNNFYEGIRYLVKLGAELHPHKEEELLYTVCSTHIRSGKIRETTEYLLELGFDPLHSGKEWSSALLRALRTTNIEALRVFIKHGVPLDKSPIITKNDKLLPLEIAAESNHPWAYEDLLLETLELISEHSVPFAETHVLNSAIHSVYQPRTRICRYLLDKGCPVNTAWNRIDFCGTNYYSPLFSIISSSSNGHKRAEIVSMLIEAGADVNQRLPSGGTPLIWLCGPHQGDEQDFAEILALLHKAGADFSAKTKKGYSLLQIAQYYHAKDSVLELLKKYGAK